MPGSTRSDTAGRHVWLVGMMGSGKTSVGRRLAQAMDRPFADVDDDVVERMGCSIAQLWGERGEAAFRELESAAIGRLAAGEPSVIATGGGAVLDRRNVEHMRNSGVVIWLDADLTTLQRRVGRTRSRPLLAGGDVTTKLADILTERRHQYEAAADFVVATDGISIRQVIDRIEAWWNES